MKGTKPVGADVTSKPEPKPRNLQIVSGAIRERAEFLLKRKSGRFLSDTDCANHDDARRICELLDELDSALLQQQLTASVREKR